MNLQEIRNEIKRLDDLLKLVYDPRAVNAIERRIYQLIDKANEVVTEFD